MLKHRQMFACATTLIVNLFVTVLNRSILIDAVVQQEKGTVISDPKRKLKLTSWKQIGEEVEGNNAYEEFGRAMSFSGDGNTLAGGSINYKKTGKAAVYRLDNDNGEQKWSALGQKLYGEKYGKKRYDIMGADMSLSFDGKVLAVSSTSRGRVFVFKLNETEPFNSFWQPMGNTIEGEMEGDEFGTSLSLSGNGKRLATGTLTFRGYVQVHRYDSTLDKWVQVGNKIEGEADGDWFGRACSLSRDGSTVVVGAVLHDGTGGNSGHVRVHRYDRAMDTWAQIGTAIEGIEAGDYFGWAVSITDDGGIIAAGARYSDEAGDRSGHARAFRYDMGLSDWVQLGQTLLGDVANCGFGGDVSLSRDGNMLVVGADDDGPGFARVFEYNSGLQSWEQVGDDIGGVKEHDHAGNKVSISKDGTVVAVAALLNDGVSYDGRSKTNVGHIRVFELTTCSDDKDFNFKKSGSKVG